MLLQSLFRGHNLLVPSTLEIVICGDWPHSQVRMLVCPFLYYWEIEKKKKGGGKPLLLRDQKVLGRLWFANFTYNWKSVNTYYG